MDFSPQKQLLPALVAVRVCRTAAGRLDRLRRSLDVGIVAQQDDRFRLLLLAIVLLVRWDGSVIDGVTQLALPPSDLPTMAAGRLPSFVVGPENEMLLAPLERLLGDMEIAEACRLFNPLALVGPSGSGKSQLVQGVVRHWRRRFDPTLVEYYTAADFCREAQAAADENRLLAWRRHVRSLRLLAIDDLQRLRPRAAVQQELRQAIDAVVAGRGVAIVSAECEPAAVRQLDPGLRDRLAAGLTIRLQRPSFAARKAILQLAADARGLTLTDDELARLARREAGSAAELIGRVANDASSKSSAAANQRELNQCAACGNKVDAVDHGARRQSALTATHGKTDEPTSRGDAARLKQIVAVTARYFGVTQAALVGPSRRTSLVEARNVAVHLARRLTSLSYSGIGHGLGGRDHTTIMHADRRLAERLTHDPAVQQAVDELDRLLR